MIQVHCSNYEINGSSSTTKISEFLSSNELLSYTSHDEEEGLGEKERETKAGKSRSDKQRMETNKKKGYINMNEEE